MNYIARYIPRFRNEVISNENTDFVASRSPPIPSTQSRAQTLLQGLSGFFFVFFILLLDPSQDHNDLLTEIPQKTIIKLFVASIMLPTTVYTIFISTSSIYLKIGLWILSAQITAFILFLLGSRSFVNENEEFFGMTTTASAEGENRRASERAKKGVSELAKKKWVTFVPSRIGKEISVGGEVGTARDKIQNKEVSQVERCEDGNEEFICSICLCGYTEGEFAVKLPCTHCFHKDCISVWTIHEIRCPLCNFDLDQDNNQVCRENN